MQKPGGEPRPKRLGWIPDDPGMTGLKPARHICLKRCVNARETTSVSR